MRSATAAAEPEDEPPGVWRVFQGLRVGPGCRYPSSVVTVLPMNAQPASRMMATEPPSRVAGLGSWKSVPIIVGRLRTSMISFTPTGMEGPLPWRDRASTSSITRSLRLVQARISGSRC
ncbi:MAG: hypothetical protein P8N43_01780 [Alphaproteobacteria bacterium]|nr:hypothetical protein [Alphaproteobacteria bacterium]